MVQTSPKLRVLAHLYCQCSLTHSTITQYGYSPTIHFGYLWSDRVTVSHWIQSHLVENERLAQSLDTKSVCSMSDELRLMGANTFLTWYPVLEPNTATPRTPILSRLMVGFFPPEIQRENAMIVICRFQENIPSTLFV